jgi:hypothetical protein
MANDESPAPKEFQINEATLDYLKLHIERQVSDRLVKWIGLPLGGGGLLAILFGLFYYLPDKMSTMIRTDRQVEEVIRTTATSFLQPDKEGGKTIATNVLRAVNEYLGSGGRAFSARQANRRKGSRLPR